MKICAECTSPIPNGTETYHNRRAVCVECNYELEKRGHKIDLPESDGSKPVESSCKCGSTDTTMDYYKHMLNKDLFRETFR